MRVFVVLLLFVGVLSTFASADLSDAFKSDAFSKITCTRDHDLSVVENELFCNHMGERVLSLTAHIIELGYHIDMLKELREKMNSTSAEDVFQQTFPIFRTLTYVEVMLNALGNPDTEPISYMMTQPTYQVVLVKMMARRDHVLRELYALMHDTGHF